MTGHDMTWYDMTWHDIRLYDMTWHDMIWYIYLLTCSSNLSLGQWSNTSLTNSISPTLFHIPLPIVSHSLSLFLSLSLTLSLFVSLYPSLYLSYSHTRSLSSQQLVAQLRPIPFQSGGTLSEWPTRRQGNLFQTFQRPWRRYASHLDYSSSLTCSLTGLYLRA